MKKRTNKKDRKISIFSKNNITIILGDNSLGKVILAGLALIFICKLSAINVSSLNTIFEFIGSLFTVLGN